MNLPYNLQRSFSKSPRGFTLLESLIAITILALALVPIYGKFSDGVVAMRRSGLTSYGMLYAQSYLASVGSLYRLENGHHTITEKDGFEIDISINDADTLSYSKANNRFSLYQVEVIVRYDGRTVAELRTLKAKVQR